jgi:nucleoid-associated protein YgaU
MFALVCVLILIWVGVYWLYEPRSGRAAGPMITRDGAAPAAQVQPEPVEPAPPIPEPVAKPDPTPHTPPPPPPQPAPQTKPPTTPHTRVVPPQFRDYVVQRGDVSFEAVAQRVFNDRKKWDIIARANPYVSSDRLKAGKTVLKIPLDPDNIQGKVVTEGGTPAAPGSPAAEPPKPPPGETSYVVQADDTLWSIAKKVYGKGGLWKTVYDANRDVIKNPDRPVAGTVLKIPAKPKD